MYKGTKHLQSGYYFLFKILLNLTIRKKIQSQTELSQSIIKIFQKFFGFSITNKISKYQINNVKGQGIRRLLNQGASTFLIRPALLGLSNGQCPSKNLTIGKTQDSVIFALIFSEFGYVPNFFYVFLKIQGKNDYVPTFL